jgi:hypothetical protein
MSSPLAQCAHLNFDRLLGEPRSERCLVALFIYCTTEED